MFLGHFGAAFGSKRVESRPSLGWLFAACQFPDLIWPVLVLVFPIAAWVDRHRTATAGIGNRE